MFDHVFCVNLDRRPDRWERFCSELPLDWPFADPRRWTAIDATQVDVPANFRGIAGAYGCWQTHLELWRLQIERRWDAVLICEDDAVFCNDAAERMRIACEALPDDWDQVYFGGQHLHTSEYPPVQVNEHILRGRYINRTHCYGMRLKFAEVAVEKLREVSDDPQERMHHVDHRLCLLHATGEYNIYCPIRFCAGQSRGMSDVRNKRSREHWWNQFPFESPVQC